MILIGSFVVPQTNVWHTRRMCDLRQCRHRSNTLRSGQILRHHDLHSVTQTTTCTVPRLHASLRWRRWLGVDRIEEECRITLNNYYCCHPRYSQHKQTKISKRIVTCVFQHFTRNRLNHITHRTLYYNSKHNHHIALDLVMRGKKLST